MVIYKLGIYDINNIKPIDLSKIIKIESSKSLQTIDDFTSKFENEDELKKYLLAKNIIISSETNERISIFYKNNGAINILPIVYSSQNNLLNVGIINIKLMNLSSNLNFLEKLLEHYDFYNFERNPQSSNILNIKLYLSDILRNKGKVVEYDRKLIEKTMNSFLITATRTLDKKTNNYKFNYRGLRDLAFLIYTFEEIENLKKLKIDIENDIKNNEDDNEIMAKLNGKWILSSEGDPDFPPNSEEEKMSIKHEEEIINSLNEENDNYQKYRK